MSSRNGHRGARPKGHRNGRHGPISARAPLLTGLRQELLYNLDITAEIPRDGDRSRPEREESPSNRRRGATQPAVSLEMPQLDSPPSRQRRDAIAEIPTHRELSDHSDISPQLDGPDLLIDPHRHALYDNRSREDDRRASLSPSHRRVDRRSPFVNVTTIAPQRAPHISGAAPIYSPQLRRSRSPPSMSSHFACRGRSRLNSSSTLSSLDRHPMERRRIQYISPRYDFGDYQPAFEEEDERLSDEEFLREWEAGLGLNSPFYDFDEDEFLNARRGLY